MIGRALRFGFMLFSPWRKKPTRLIAAISFSSNVTLCGTVCGEPRSQPVLMGGTLGERIAEPDERGVAVKEIETAGLVMAGQRGQRAAIAVAETDYWDEKCLMVPPFSATTRFFTMAARWRQTTHRG